MWHGSRYSVEDLDAVLQQLFGDSTNLFRHEDQRDAFQLLRLNVAVTAVTSIEQQLSLFSNYNVNVEGRLRYRPIDPEVEIKVWEAYVASLTPYANA
jgi:hypothetical protein